MALKGRMSRMILNLSFLALDLSIVLSLSVQPMPGNIGSKQTTQSPHPFSLKVNKVKDTEVASSVVVDDALVFPIVQQPKGEPNYVSAKNGELTLFSSASQYGNIGLLAHNYLSGKSFSHLTVGQEIRLIYNDGKTEYFVVTEVLEYQALQPKSPFSAFQNLNNTKEILSAQQMFARVYEGNRHITFQTCIAKYGESSWGRLFVLALPEAKSLSFVH